jgi:hypothetical protein
VQQKATAKKARAWRHRQFQEDSKRQADSKRKAREAEKNDQRKCLTPALPPLSSVVCAACQAPGSLDIRSLTGPRNAIALCSSCAKSTKQNNSFGVKKTCRALAKSALLLAQVSGSNAMLSRDQSGLANSKQPRVVPSVGLAASAAATVFFSRATPEQGPPPVGGLPWGAIAGASAAAAMVLQARAQGEEDVGNDEASEGGDDEHSDNRNSEACHFSAPALPPPPLFESAKDAKLPDEPISSSSSSAETGRRCPTAFRGESIFKQLVRDECTPKLHFSEDGRRLMSQFSTEVNGVNAITSTSSIQEDDHEDTQEMDSTPPSGDAMSTRLKKALGPSFDFFQGVFRRLKHGKRTETEVWVSDVQRKTQKHLLARCRFERGTGRPPKLFFLTVYNSRLGVAVSFEERCPGMIKTTFENVKVVTQRARQGVLQLSAFAPSMDYNSALGSKKGIPAQRNNCTRQENILSSELTKLIKSFELEGASVAAVYDSPVDALSSSSAQRASNDSQRCYYQSGEFKAWPTEEFKFSFAQKLAQYSSSGSQDYALSVLGCTLKGRLTEGDCFVALGCIGQKMLLNVIRDFSDSGHLCGVQDASRELLFELGLVSSSLRAVRSRPERHRQVHVDVSGGGGGPIEDDEEADHFSANGDEWCALNDAPGSSSSSSSYSSSSSAPNQGLTEYSRHAVPEMVICVAEEDDGDGKKNRIYSMAQYSEGGLPTRSVPVLLHRSDRSVDFGVSSRCRCYFAGLGHSLLGNQSVPGCEFNSCFHECLLNDPRSAKTLRAKPCMRPLSVPTGSSYLLILSQPVRKDHSEPHLHVFVFAAGAVGVDSDAIVTLTQRHVSCSKCHNGGKQEISGQRAKPCPHGAHIREVVGDTASEAATKVGTDGQTVNDVMRMSAVLHSSGASVASKTTFDVDAGIWRSRSLSSLNEEKNHAAFGELARPCNVEMDIEEISPQGCNLGGPMHVGYDPEANMLLVEPIPNFESPLHNSGNKCVYFDDSNLEGWTQKEVDAQGNTHPHCQVHYLTHSRKATVFTRCCSEFHDECRIFYTGRADGFHRDTADTMMRHEVILLYWQ